jgi:hypothetical protein
MAKKFIEIRMNVVVEYDTDLYDEDDVVSKSVLCFYEEDKTGVENFLPKAEGLEVIDYLITNAIDITEVYNDKK